MKRRVLLFSAMFFCLVLGWGLGFLRLPMAEYNHSFWVGCLAGIGAILLLLVLISLFRSSNTRNRDRKVKSSLTARWLILFGVVLAGGGFFIRHQQQAVDEKQRLLDQQNQMIEAIEFNNPSLILQGVFSELMTEVQSHPNDSLSPKLVDQIARISEAFRPYPYWNGKDSLTTKAYSPERGRLLEGLLILNLDAASFRRILESANFSHADLSKVDLSGVDLSGIELSHALMKDGKLSGCILRGANLEGAEFWGATMDSVILDSANLRRADLRWANLTHAQMVATNLDGANLDQANLLAANLSGARSEWSFWNGSLLTEANLAGCNLLGAQMKQANFTRANLSDALIREVDFYQAIFSGTQISQAPVGVNWMERFNQSQVVDGAFIQEQYEVVKGSSALFKDEIYVLQKKGVNPTTSEN